MVKGRERRLITRLKTHGGKSQVSTQPSSSIFRVETRAIGLNTQRTGGWGQKGCRVKLSQVWSGWSLSQSLFGAGFSELLSLSQQVIIAWWVVSPEVVLLFLRSRLKDVIIYVI
jgi:hypothetical protein